MTEQLTPQDAADVKCWAADSGYKVALQRVKLTAGDHARVAALRGIIRALWQRQVNVERKGLSTLVIGASAVELRQWAEHGHVTLWLTMCEAKDGGRTYLHIAREAMAQLETQ